MKFTADFHIHSKYSRATSRDGVPEVLDFWAGRKGLQLIGTGDFTHPAWREELREKLKPAEQGLYALKDEYRLKGSTGNDGTRFVLSAEISSIYKKKDKVRKVHNVILLPDLESADKLSYRLEQIGNLHSDGRPILGLDSRDLLEITLETCPEAVFIPAHIWTPHFSLFGAYSGFDSIEECFEDMTPYIHSLETGLSSDPPMNWRISALDRFTLVSNSDAHSPSKLAREANLFNTELSYSAISRALSHPDTDEFIGTLEFYPEEGKYHVDGHRNCGVSLSPAETEKAGGLCPVCGKRITVGVLHRAEDLADREEGFIPQNAKKFERIIPLQEAVAASLGMTAASKRVQGIYGELLNQIGPELFVLRDAPFEEVYRAAGPCVAEGIKRVREGRVRWEPGYDGAYGKATVLEPDEISFFSGQTSLFKAGQRRKNKTIAEKREVKTQNTKGIEATAASLTLNAGQKEAVTAAESAVSVIAGPGTGKTRTLVEHIKFLIETEKIPPQEITAVTFTNQAADEMKKRLKQELAKGKKINIGTFHSICLKLLTKWRGEVVLISESEALDIADKIKNDLGLKITSKDLLQAVSEKKNGFFIKSRIPKLPEEVYERYRQELGGALDFDDLLLEVLKTFESENHDSPFSCLLVDEFQDINAVQYQLIKAWGAGGRQVFAIGDPDQAIYGFRGSEPRCFEDFKRDFEGCREITLTRNYRSTPEILQSAGSLIESQPYKRHIEANRKNGSKVRILYAESPFSEALFTAREINRMVGGTDMLDAQGAEDRNISFSDIAVLYRTHRQSELLEECLKKEGIPYAVTGRDRFLDAESVREVLRFIRILSGEETENILSEDEGGRYTQFKLAADSNILKADPFKIIDAWMKKAGGDEALEKLRNSAVMHKTIRAFMENIALGREGDIKRFGARAFKNDAVSLMTLHGSKGLEFPIVFICGVKKDVVPLKNANEDEERRLFYVGMTRAENELVILSNREGASPFLKDLPASLTEIHEVDYPQGKQLSLF